MKVLHIITGLAQGGAESALFRLTTYRKDPAIVHVVISMVDLGVYGRQFDQNRIEVHMLGMPRGRLTINGIVRLWRLIKQIKPDVVQTWMYHADLLGGIVSRLAGVRNVFWGIVHFNLDRSVAGASTRWTAKACAWMSYIIPRKIISCSKSANSVHKKIGYDASKFLTIPLGYDLADLKRNDEAGTQLRQCWGISPGLTLYGCLARWNPQKDHYNLLTAFDMLNKEEQNVSCVLAGREIDDKNAELKALISNTSIPGEKLTLAGVVEHIPSVMNAIDIHVLSSLGEAFPNVVAEAMACETPCVVTDVGDAAQIVGDTGWIVPPGNSKALKDAMQEALKAKNDPIEWEQRRKRCRARILDNFSMERMCHAYSEVWHTGISSQ